MPFRNAVFAGGGSRCFWQLGFWEGAIEAGLDLRSSVKFVGSTSAGCAIATAAVLDRSQAALDLFKGLTAENPRNIHWENVSPLSWSPLLPHARMYREALERFIRPDDLTTLKGISIQFLMSASPTWLSGAAATVLGFVIHVLEQTLRDPIHPNWAKLAGYRPVVGRAADCSTPDDLIDMVLAASCVPPVLPEGWYGNQRVLDGGLFDNVPTLLVDGEPGETLALLSRRYERPLPSRPHTTYVQPSKPIPIDKFDYANPQGLQDTFELGLEDGKRFAALQHRVPSADKESEQTRNGQSAWTSVSHAR